MTPYILLARNDFPLEMLEMRYDFYFFFKKKK